VAGRLVEPVVSSKEVPVGLVAEVAGSPVVPNPPNSPSSSAPLTKVSLSLFDIDTVLSTDLPDTVNQKGAAEQDHIIFQGMFVQGADLNIFFFDGGRSLMIRWY
jgi:hypothetical protein